MTWPPSEGGAVPGPDPAGAPLPPPPGTLGPGEAPATPPEEPREKDLTELLAANPLADQARPTAPAAAAQLAAAAPIGDATWWHSVLDALSANVALVDASGTVVDVNAAWERFGRENTPPGRYKSCIGTNYLEICRRATGPFSEGAVEIAEKLRMVLAGTIPSFLMEYPCPSPAEPHRWFVMRAGRLPGGGAVVTHLNMTDLRLAREARERAEERQRALLEATRDVVYTLTPGGVITSLNSAFEALTGWARADWLGQECWPLVHPDDVPRAMEMTKRQLNGEAPPPFELRILRRDGTYFDAEFVSNPVRVDGISELVGSARDITERKERERERARAETERRAKEEAEAASRAKDQFLAVLSHELRTPLTPVLSLATALEDTKGLPPGCHDAMRIVRRNVELEARLIDDLLDLTRIVRGKLALRECPVDVHRLLREVMEICEEDLRAKNLRAFVDFRAAETTARADPARLEQVFWNLIKNAVKFTPEGGTVTVATANADGGQLLSVRVTDTGVGVEPEVLRKIFEPFEQGGEAVTRQFGGLGLGLAIGKGIVEAHGGRITAESAGPGTGATFTVELATLPGVKEEERPPQGKRPARPMRILLVEDHADTARVMRTLLKGMGHEVVRVTTVRAALDALGRTPFDLMISDLGLPDGTGWDLMKHVREAHPDTRGIALSGYGMERDIARSKEAGFEEHVVKPFNFARLTELIDAVSSR